MGKVTTKNKKLTLWLSTLVVFIVLVVIAAFILVNFCEVHQ